MGAYREPLQERHVAEPSCPRFLDVGRRGGPFRLVGHVEHDGRQVADVHFVLVGGRREEVADKHADAVHGASAERIVQRGGLVRDPPGSRQRRLERRPDGEVQVRANARQHAAGAGEGDEPDRSRRQEQDRGHEHQGRRGERGPDVAHRPRHRGGHGAIAEPIQQTAHGALQFAQRRQRPVARVRQMCRQDQERLQQRHGQDADQDRRQLPQDLDRAHHEQQRQEGHGGGDRAHGDRTADLPDAAYGGSQWPPRIGGAFGIDVLGDDQGVVHDQADHEKERGDGHHVDGEAQGGDERQ